MLRRIPKPAARVRSSSCQQIKCPLSRNTFLNGPNPASFLFIFGLFKQTLLQFLQHLNVKNVHPVSGAGIQITTF